MVNSKGSDYPGVWKEGEKWGSYIMIKGKIYTLEILK